MPIKYPLTLSLLDRFLMCLEQYMIQKGMQGHDIELVGTKPHGTANNPVIWLKSKDAQTGITHWASVEARNERGGWLCVMLYLKDNPEQTTPYSIPYETDMLPTQEYEKFFDANEPMYGMLHIRAAAIVVYDFLVFGVIAKDPACYNTVPTLVVSIERNLKETV